MNRFSTFLTAAFLSAAMPVATAAPAMEIQQFDKMATQDQADFVSQLVGGAERF